MSSAPMPGMPLFNTTTVITAELMHVAAAAAHHGATDRRARAGGRGLGLEPPVEPLVLEEEDGVVVVDRGPEQAVGVLHRARRHHLQPGDVVVALHLRDERLPPQAVRRGLCVCPELRQRPLAHVGIATEEVLHEGAVTLVVVVPVLADRQ